MKIWVDADACPRDVKDVVYRAAERLGIATVLVANQSMYIPRSAHISLIVVPKGFDVADARIVLESAAGDVVITADIPLAALLVPKGVIVIDPRGELYDEENIGERLNVRDFMAGMRDTGVATGGPKAFGPKEKARFASALDRVLTRARSSG